MKIKHVFLFCLASVFAIPEVAAQAPIQAMNANPVMAAEASFLNPAFLNATRRMQVNILPFMAAHIQASNNLVSNGTLINYLQSSENNENQYEPIQKLINNLKPNNSVNFQTDLTLLHVTFGIGSKENPWRAGISVRQHLMARVSVNDNLLRLLYEGNKQYAGQTISLKPEISFLGYTDIGLSLSKTLKINDLKITPAFRLRYLIGEAALYTKEAGLDMYTEENGEYIDVSGQLNGFAGGIINVGELINNEDDAENDSPAMTPTGRGFAIDLGVNIVYKNISISLASIDNGSIRFKGNSAWYIASQNTSYRWDGYDIAAELNGDADAAENFAPLESIDLEAKQQNFSVGIGSKFTLNGNYGLIEKTDKSGAAYFVHNAGISMVQGFKSRFNLTNPNWTTIYYQINLGNRLTAGVNYNNSLGFSDIGANVGFRLASLNIGLGSNSMLMLVNPDASRKLDLFLHLGFAF